MTDEWLSPIPIGETSIRLDLLPTSVTNIVVHVPGVDDPSTCPPWAKFSAEATVRTEDSVLDTHARGSVQVKQGRVSLDIPSGPEAAAAIEVWGRRLRQSISPGGHGTVSTSSETLAASIASPR
jgi:hypothetical protein